MGETQTEAREGGTMREGRDRERQGEIQTDFGGGEWVMREGREWEKHRQTEEGESGL